MFVPVLPARVAATKEPIGKAVGSPAATLTYWSVIVDATLTAAQGYTAEPGTARPSPSATAARWSGWLSRSTARSRSRGRQPRSPSAGAPSRRHRPHVGVTIDAESSAVATLAIPIGALYANGSGGAYVILAGHNPQHLAVTVGQAVGLRPAHRPADPTASRYPARHRHLSGEQQRLRRPLIVTRNLREIPNPSCRSGSAPGFGPRSSQPVE